MGRDDCQYFRERAIAEQVAAERATCVEARHIHDELAMIYRFKAAMLSSSGGAGSCGEAEQPQIIPAIAA